MKDYNTITADLLMKAPHGIDCYVSNDSYEDALQDIHCTGDAVKRIFPCSDGCGGVAFTDTEVVWGYVIPVHLVVEQLAQATNELLDRRGSRDHQPIDGEDEDLLSCIQWGKLWWGE